MSTGSFLAGTLFGFVLLLIVKETLDWLHRKYVLRTEALTELRGVLRKCGCESEFIERIWRALR